MYAIVNIAGQQFKVAKDQQIFVHRLQGDEGASIEFDKVLLAENEGKFSLGADLKSAKVSAKIVSHVKGDKVIVFKKKRRKTTQKWNNHRQSFTQILIQGVLGKGETLKDEIKVEKYEKKVFGPKPKNTETAAPVAEVKAEKKAPAKKAPAKKAAAKKTTTKKKED